MKRSEINAIIKRFEALLEEHCFELPPFCKFTPEEWKTKGHEYDEIRDNMLGWDVTDYGMGDYAHLGLALITIRNGNVHNEKYTKTYAEKVIMCEPGQVSPMHFHWNKMEDIINRGGGDIQFTLYNATSDEQLDKENDVLIFRDGRRYYEKPGAPIILKPGESLSLYPYYYHEFIIPEDSSPVLIGEVSMCNDDNTDNRFLNPLGRFPTIEEDEEPYRLLCNEYPPACD
ncbi:MAG: D-lyxose/D-mannose family sugar isomerase [Oscillospiraceae bacterium]|nr:D-lyxose/D-mannose family sugar isomerase [Oscillospiraceae bacterium]